MVVGHGTRDPGGTRQFFELVERVDRRCELTVAPAVLEFQQPDIDAAVESLVGQGIRHIHIAPLLLFAAGHAKTDIPGEVNAAIDRLGVDVTTDQCRPLSRTDALVAAATDRLMRTLNASGDGNADDAGDARNHTKPFGEDDEIALVMVGRGSRDPCATSDMRILGQWVYDDLRRIDPRLQRLQTCFYAMAAPKLPESLDAVAERWVTGPRRKLLVHPHLLFAGRLFDAIARQCDEANQRIVERTGLVDAVRLSGYLGPEPDVADALLTRIAQLRRTGELTITVR